MRFRNKTFSPAEKIIREEETTAQKLQRMARALLPVHVITEKEKRGARQYCVCGAELHANAKVRQKLKVCDDCAKIIQPLPTGWAAAKIKRGKNNDKK